MYQAGADVLILQADVTDFDQMHAVMQNIENEYGTLHGVIHAAGIVGEGAIKPIIETDRKNSEIQFLPKINGTKVLAKLLEGKSLDFVFLQSSLSAILGGLGLGAYSAANQYLDTFAAVQNRTNDTPWICVDWDGWLFEEEQEIERTLVDLSMTPDEGVLIFEKLMSMVGETHIIISTADLDVRIKQWVQTSYGDIRESILIEPDLEKQEQSGSTMSFPRPGLQTPYVPARDDLEESIVQTWQHVLGIEPIGIHDDFFELGGHSLLATQLVTRLRDTYNVQLPLRRLFESATVAGIAELISDAISERALEKPSDEEIRWETKKLQETARDGHIFAVPREGDLQLSYGQQRLWFLDQMDPESPLYNNFSAIRMTGVLNIEGFQYSLNKMIERHEVLRTTFREIEGKPSQIIHPNMVVPINLIDLSDKTLEDAENKVIQLATEEARKPFDLSEAPLLRVTLIQLKEDEYILFQTMHHIISDGWSVRVLIEEVGAY
jgi:acyl carrier protein